MRYLGIVAACLLAGSTVFGQQYTIQTYAGGSPLPNAAAAGNATIGVPGAVASDFMGNVYFVSDQCVFKIDLAAQALTRVAGNSRAGYSGDGQAATAAELNNPQGLAIDPSNNLYIADTGNNRIRKVVLSTGIITTIAGPTFGYSSTPQLAAGAALNSPQGLAADGSGNLYIADTGNHVIRMFVPGTGIISTVAGTGTAGTSPENYPATSAQLNTPTSVAVDLSGNIYIADSKNNKIREVLSGNIVTIAGTGVPGYLGDGNSALQAELSLPTVVSVASGLVYLIDSGNTRVREIQATKTIVTLAGPVGAPLGTGGLFPVMKPAGIAADPFGNLFIADATHITKISSSQNFFTFAGNGLSYSTGDGGPATSGQLVNPEGLAANSAGLYIADSGEARIRLVLPGGNISSPPDGAPSGPAGVAVDPAGNFYIADALGNKVWKVSGGAATVIAGTGAAGYSGDTGPASAALLNQPNGVAVDSAGNIYIADTGNNRIRKVTFTNSIGIINTIAGNNSAGFQGDTQLAIGAVLNQPYGVAIDSSSNVYIADTGNNRIRKISSGTGVITTVAGNGNLVPLGDGGQAVAAAIVSPHAVALDSLNNLYIPDYSGRVRRVSSNGIITTIAGTGTPGYSGEGVPATTAQLNQPWGVAVDSSGNVYVSDAGEQAVRILIPQAVTPLSILTTSPLPSGTAGTPYEQALFATGGTPPYTWSVAQGSLPAGLSLSPTAGSITGTPTISQSYLFTVQITDSASVVSTAVLFTILISPSSLSGLSITTPTQLVPAAVVANVGLPYSQVLTAVSGNLPYTWTLVSGSLPNGLQLSPSGLISGAPQSTGPSSFAVRVVDASNAIATQTFTLQVISAGNPSRNGGGVLAHFAAGGPWTTKAYLTNIATAPVVVSLIFHTDDGSILPVNITQQGSTQPFSTNSFTGVMSPNSNLVIDAGAQLTNTETGWVDVLTSGSQNSLAGFAVFRLTSNGIVSEGTTPLQTVFESKMNVPFDDTSGYNTDLGIANLSASPATISVTILDRNGNQLGTDSLQLQPNAHTAFVFPSQFAATANQQGLVQFVNTSGGSLGGVGLRANTGAATGTFTSVPVIFP